jgi:hypothetical protein
LSWLIVVAVLIVGAIALHFGEKAKEREQRAKRLAKQRSEPLHQLSFTREVRERWSADLRAMTLQVSRAEAGAPLAVAEQYGLERDGAGGWSITGSALALPAGLAEQLEARFQALTKVS